MVVETMTKAMALRLGYVRPKNGGEGKMWSRLLAEGNAEAVSIDEGYRAQWYYKIKEQSDG